MKAETEQIIGFAFDVLDEVGHGLNEKIYENPLTVFIRVHLCPSVVELFESLVSYILMPFKELHFAFVALRGGHGTERAQVPAFAGRRIHFPRVKPIFTRSQFTDHIQNLRSIILIT